MSMASRKEQMNEKKKKKKKNIQRIVFSLHLYLFTI